MKPQTYQPPGVMTVAEGCSGQLPCVLCGQPPAAHPFDLICPMTTPLAAAPDEPMTPPRDGPTALMYVERCGDHDPLHCGPAWIGRVVFSQSGRTVYYRGMRLVAVAGGAANGANHVDPQTGVGYWVSGVKKRGSNRHPNGGGGVVEIDNDVREEYEALRATPEA